jgi:AraC-like DNA-binding protein
MIVTHISLAPDDYTPHKENGGAEFERALSALTITPVSAVWYKCRPEWSVGPRVLQNPFWSFIIGGRGVFTIDGKKEETGPGDIIFFPPGIEHSMRPRKGSAMEMINGHFHARTLGVIDIFSLLGAGGRLHEPDFFRPLAVELARVFALKPPGWREHMAALSSAAARAAFYRLPRRRKLEPGALKKLARLWPALEFIGAGFCSAGLSLSGAASAAGLSGAVMRRLFRETLGQSPVKFLNSKRVAEACRLLRETDYSVKETAGLCGFKDHQYFHRVFSAVTGVTPAGLRRSPVSGP